MTTTGQTTSEGPAAADIAARVDGQPIYVREVQREVAKVINDRQVEPAALKMLQAQALEQLIGQRLIVAYLRREKQAASEQDLDLALQRIAKQLQAQSLTLDEYFQRSDLSLDEFRRALMWQISWQRYRERYLTDQNLENYFAKHRRQYDGTRLCVAQILFAVDPAADRQTLAAAIEQANAIRAEIAAGKTSFADAAKMHSQAPSGKDGGDLGFIGRYEPMPEAFSAAAFELKVGAVSAPVVSTFGVHLIQCLEETPGQKSWREVRGELEIAVTRYLFDWVVSRQRGAAQIEYTGRSPYFQPGTKELAETQVP